MATKKVNHDSILFSTDSYKVSMWRQYPSGTTGVYSYIEARSAPEDMPAETVFLGVQYFIKKYLLTPITEEDVMAAEMFWAMHGEPFNTEGWLRVVKEHKGLLPIIIRAVPEGSVVPIKNVLCTVENTDPNLPWLTTWVETRLLGDIWYMSTVATNSRNIKRLLLEYLEATGTPELIDFKLHDFGFRGVSSHESAGTGGMAHLVNFKGTDTPAAILTAHIYYSADLYATGFSIPAAEHSTITAWGKANEKEAYENMLEQFGKPGAILAVVSDSYNILEACRIWVSLKDKIIASEAKLVIRPDSGLPCEVLPQVMEILSEGFGFTINEKGYKVLSNVAIIWGDGIEYYTIETILQSLVDYYAWSADNFAFGMGGALLQHPRRDDYGWAMKASAVCDKNGWYGISKSPVHAPEKSSKQGRVTLYKDKNGFRSGVQDWEKDALVTVYDAGETPNDITFSEIRDNAKIA